MVEGVSDEETDLFVLSLEDREDLQPLHSRGEARLPSLAGRRLVWQDAGLGGDDIRTALLPEGL